MKIVSFPAMDEVILTGLLEEVPNSKTIFISVHGMKNNVINNINQVLSEVAVQNGYSFLAFNNRGHDIVSYTEKIIDGKKVKKLGGASFEDILESYDDVKGAIDYALSLGYSKVYLVGHSLGCTKIVYTYQKLIENKENSILNAINGILLLSLVDLPHVQQYFLGNRFEEVLAYAEQKEREGKLDELMPSEVFIHPISVKTYLRYFKYNSEINFANYSSDDKLEELNKISCPLFMRWGTDKEMILQSPEELLSCLKNKLANSSLDIAFLAGANHSYYGKEADLANQIIKFVKNIEKA